MISIIIPVYNVEKYLDECLKSVCEQSYSDLEIIIVNDGSSDGSLDICKRWKSKDSRIRLVDQENRGLSAARNAGIEIATGDYLAFVDSDDFISKTMYEHLLEAIIRNKADIAICGRYIYKDKVIGKNFARKSEISLNRTQAIKSLLEGNNVGVAAWDKLYSKKCFDNVRYPVGETNEDAAVICRLLGNASKVVHTGTTEYYYRSRSGSITKNQFSVKSLKVVEKNLLIVKEYIENNCPEIIASYNKYYIMILFSMLLKAVKADSLSQEQLAEKKRLEKILRDYFKYFIGNKNISFKNKLIACTIRLHIYEWYLNNCKK